jgi:hypothetical protein
MAIRKAPLGPVKGKPLSANNPRLRALEAYIIPQRNGTAFAYGRH